MEDEYEEPEDRWEYWICDICGSKENLRGATMAVGPKHNCPPGFESEGEDNE